MKKNTLKKWLVSGMTAILLSLSAIPVMGSSAVALAANGSDAESTAQLTRNTVAAGAIHNLVVKNDGTVWAWGDNSKGQLGIENLDLDSILLTPQQVPGLTDVVSVAVGTYFSLALKSDGTVWAWGDNTYGQIGIGTSGDIVTTPHQVQNLANVVQISAGFEFALALEKDGSAYSWGNNDTYQLGVNGAHAENYSFSPVPGKMGILANVKKISAGNNYGIALEKDDEIWCWGASGGGTGSFVPDTLRGTPTGIIDISAGFSHCLLLTSDGAVWGWGKNEAGQLGYIYRNSSDSPYCSVQQIPGLANIKAISAGYYHSAVIDANGQIYTFGINGPGQLGDGSDPQQKLYSIDPVQVKTDYATQVSTGILSTLALKSNGTVYGWGSNDVGELGIGTLGGPAKFTDPDTNEVMTGYNVPVKIMATGLNKVTLNRLAGNEAVNTAVAISQSGWADGADTVVLATVANFPDALAGAPLAHQFNAPILLTDSKKLNPDVQNEIVRLHPAKVLIVGGPAVVSSEIEALLKADYDVTRIAGFDAYETAAEIAKYMYKTDPGIAGKAVIAYGKRFEDALSVSPWAAQQEIPILLSDKDTLPPATLNALKELNVSETTIVGGTAVISQKIEKQLPNPTRYWGMDQYQTSIAIANDLIGNPGQIYLATGARFPDALAGSALAAQSGSPIILIDGNLTNQAPLGYFMDNAPAIKDITILGGTAVVTNAAVTKLTSILPF